MRYWEVFKNARQDAKILQMFSQYLIVNASGVVDEDVESLLTGKQDTGNIPSLSEDQPAALEARVGIEKEALKEDLRTVKRVGNPAAKKNPGKTGNKGQERGSEGVVGAQNA